MNCAWSARPEDSMGSMYEALRRASRPILWMACASFLGISAGMLLVHAGFAPAIQLRDGIVDKAIGTSSTLQAERRGHRFEAAGLDVLGNIALSAAPTTVMGLSVVLPFPFAVARGVVGGVVSIDGNHRSRLADTQEAIYYLSVLILQVIPFVLAGGVGVRLGLGFLLPRSSWAYADSTRWLGLPAEGIRDVIRIYCVAVPLFAVASLVEFLAR